jgi:hypothetical protein
MNKAAALLRARRRHVNRFRAEGEKFGEGDVAL